MNLSLVIGMQSHDSPSQFFLIQRAREMRRAPTRSEALLWAQIRDRKLGARFRRQAPLDRYIVDFYGPCHKLVVEVDGAIHDSQREQDAIRQRELELLFGVHFVRIRAELVEHNVLDAVAVIRAALM